jgi:hypothetical protein
MDQIFLVDLFKLVLLSAIVTFPMLIVAYAFAQLSKNRWRYSLRTLLIITTLLAALLGVSCSLQ